MSSNSEEENLAAILALIILLILFVAYCCWGSSFLRKFSSGMSLCRQENSEASQNVRSFDVGQSASSPTIILLPHGRILVVDGTFFSRFHASSSGFDLFELGNQILRQERNRTLRSASINELDQESTIKDCTSRAESPLPPSYASLFCDFQQNIPPSYPEALQSRIFTEASSMRRSTDEENNADSIV